MLNFALRWWRADVRHLLAAGAIVALATAMYTGAAHTVAEMERTMYAPARRFIGGEAAVMTSGAAFTYTVLDNGQRWSSIPGLGWYPSAALPAGQWVQTFIMPVSVLIEGTEVDMSLWARGQGFYAPELRLNIVAGRHLEPGDEGRLVAVIPYRLTGVVGLGSRLSVTVPRPAFAGSASGLLGPVQPRTFDLEVIGVYQEPLLGWPNIVVPLSTLDEILTAMAPALDGQLVMAAPVADRGAWSPELERELARALPPELKLVSVATVLSAVTSEAESVKRSALVINSLAVIVSLASIVASILYLLSRRRRELALLLACGVSHLGLGLVVLTEIVLLAGLAGLLGSLGYRVITGSYHGWASSLVVCLGIAAAAGAAGLAPVLSLMRVSPMEVLRNE